MQIASLASFAFKILRNATIIPAFVAALALIPSAVLNAFGAELVLEETDPATYLDVYQFKPTPFKPNMKVGLALGGGGARGAAHVGVIKVLEKEGIKIDYIAGTSVGAIVGGLYTAGVPLDTLEEDAVAASFMKKFMNVSLPVRIMMEPLTLSPRLLGSKPYDGLYSGKGFRKYLDNTLPNKIAQVEHAKIPFAAVSFNLLDGKTYMIRSGDLGYAMQASSAVPGLRRPVPLGGKLFVDGGVACNLPVKQCRQMGADFVIAVNVDQPFKVGTDGQFRKLGSVSNRLINWDLWDLDKPQEQLADVTIHPDTTGIEIITTSKSQAKRGYLAGVKAAEEMVPEIKRRLAGTSSAMSQGGSQ
jgi:NTE family protein